MRASFLLIASVASLPGLVIPVQAADYYGSGLLRQFSLDLAYQDNLSRAEADADIKEDFVYTARAGFGYKKVLKNSQLTGFLQLEYQAFDAFSDLNNLAGLAHMDFVIQPQPGFYSPWIEFSLQAGKREFNNSRIRSGETLEFGLAAGRRISDRATARAGYSYSQRFANGDVFDLDNHNFTVDAGYRLSGRFILYANYTAMLGESVSTATPNNIIRSAAKAIAPDDVFSPGTGPGCENRRCAYRLDTDTHMLELGVGMDINHALSVDISATLFRSNWGDNRHYDGIDYILGVDYRF